MEHEIEIVTFGGFYLKYDNKPIIEKQMRFNKPLELLVLLLQNKNFSNEQLMEQLWEEDDIENPAGALKNAVYSLRKILRAISPQEDFIVIQGNKYCWNSKINVLCDLWEFEKTQQNLSKEKAPDTIKQLEMCRRALKLYTGDFLPEGQNRRWIMQSANYLRQEYLSTVFKLGEILLKRESKSGFSEVLAECNRGILLEPLCEDLYVCLFAAMRKLDMKSAITNYYPVVANMFFDELGVAMPESVCDVYVWASEGSNKTLESIRHIQQDLEEVTRDTRPIRGAYCCPYEMFKHIFHMVVRNAVRNDNSVILMLFTLNSKTSMPVAKGVLVKAMLYLQEVIKEALRKGDVVSRYSRNQYIIMISVAKDEDCEIVEQRIQKQFNSQKISSTIQLAVVTGKPDPIV